MRKLIFVAVVLAFILGSIDAATAQVYPSRPVTFIVPFAAGGPTDTVARIMADRMKTSLGQRVIVENVTGAGGSIGVGRVASATGDGYTLVIGIWSTHVANGAVYPLQYDVQRDFEPVSLLTDAPIWLVGRIGFPATNLKEMIAWLKANPDKASQGTVGVGTAGHIAGAFFQSYTGTRLQVVPYRLATTALQDLTAGHIDLMFTEASYTLPFVRTMKAYAIMAKTRWAPAPDTPTVDEMEAPGLYMSFWQGLWAPKGTSKDVIAKLNAAVVDALADPAVRQTLVGLGMQIPLRAQQTPEALAAFQKAEIEKWWPIIKAANIKAE